MATPMGLIYKALFPSISTFETPPKRGPKAPPRKVWFRRMGHMYHIQKVHPDAGEGSVSKVEMATPMGLIYKALFPSISTFETPPEHALNVWPARPFAFRKRPRCTISSLAC